MRQGVGEDDPFLAAAFLQRYLRDQRESGPGSLFFYQHLFPGHEELIAREYQALQVVAEPSGDQPRFPIVHNRLNPGQTVASYEIVALIGKGGMGEVYRARDSRLNRDIAIKVLPPDLAGQPERVSRFEREARALASLNHPNIASIHELEHSGQQMFLIMELVPGLTLAERVARGPLPMREALEIAAQIAAALEAAHDAGVIHRDLKPSNVKVTPDGRVKLLDFGLARSFGVGVVADPSSSPIETSMGTQEGMILGTASYMSPEQVNGGVLDGRTDVFSFGCVLYEMLTGRPPFEGRSVQEILARVLEREPDWHRLPPELTPRVLELLERCLAKDVRVRRRSCGDIRLDMERALIEPGVETREGTARPSKDGTRISRSLVPILIVVLGLVLALPYLRTPAEAPEWRVHMTTPATTDPSGMAISPDGLQMVFVASGDGAPRLWVRPLATDSMRELPGTEDARFPFWSPDSRSVAFFGGEGGLMSIDIDGGPPRKIADAAPGMGGCWGPDGTILFAPGAEGPLFRVPSAGGTAVALAEPDRPRQSSHRFPHLLPDGRQFLFYVVGTEETSGIYLGSLEGPGTRRLTAADTAGIYVPPGWLLFIRQGELVAQRFDPSVGELSGDVVQVAASVGSSDQGCGAFSASVSGLVAYRSGADVPRRLTWFSRSGEAIGAVGRPDEDDLLDPEISPDGNRVAVTRTMRGNTDVWLIDAARSTRVTQDPATDRFPVWSPGSDRIVFTSTRTGVSDLYEKAVSGSSGSEVRLLGSPLVKNPSDWSSDGAHLLYFEVRPQTLPDLWVLPLRGEQQPFAFADSSFAEVWGQFSPDHRWIAYQSSESGTWEIYVRPFPGPGGQWTISTGGGVYPRWAPDGKELYYLAPDARLMAVPISISAATLDAGEAVALFRTQIHGGGANVIGRSHQYDVAPDGRFLINVTTEVVTTPITLVLNWKPPAR